MAAISDYLENILINLTLRGIGFTAPVSVYVGLFTTDPTDANTGIEVVSSGTAYTRMLVIFAAPVNGIAVNSTDIVFPTATGDWGSITHIGIYDSLTSGNLLFHGALSATKIILTGDVFKFASGALSISFS